ncbi:YggS family pyridoxal phosphate-dependent enzyme [Ornithinibacillus bavariensis]|uniref:YggS family pyridoxal phosphate-dependent enzyme n=1 Tax=Ornithinibacillus bavariensis TaxID=545502 RepID=UPI000ED25C9B|nr:YggS family pyridoxal phosphate-dependent enzyme [Ornithinibacillus sp.]
MDVTQNLQQIQTEMKAACQKSNRNFEEITIIGVTKYVTIERTREALQSGIINLGENRLEGFREKYQHFGNEATWHFIGSLQTRKVKDIIEKIDYLHSLDRLSLAEEIEKRAQKPVKCFVQVNVSGEESKHGLKPNEVMSFINDIAHLTKISVVGLMTMAPNTDDKELLHNVFRELRILRDKVKESKLQHAPCEFLSMGMSNDYPIAIEEGATHVRIGSKLVGS